MTQRGQSDDVKESRGQPLPGKVAPGRTDVSSTVAAARPAAQQAQVGRGDDSADEPGVQHVRHGWGWRDEAAVDAFRCRARHRMPSTPSMPSAPPYTGRSANAHNRGQRSIAGIRQRSRLRRWAHPLSASAPSSPGATPSGRQRHSRVRLRHPRRRPLPPQLPSPATRDHQRSSRIPRALPLR